MEQRYMQMKNVTTRSDENGDKYLEGIFVAYDSIYNVYPGATESIERGAFTESINGDVRALYNHNSDIVLGRTSAGTLELRDTEEGLWGRIKINPNDTDAMNAYARIQRGDLTGCSFGFDIPEGGEEVIYKDNGDVHFKIKKCSPLYEVSPTVFPAYEATHISARRKDIEEAHRRQNVAWKEKAKARLKGETNGSESIDASQEDRH